MLKREQKARIVEEIAKKLGDQKIALLSDFHGVSVGKMQALRRALKKEGAEYKVAKKTLFDRAFEQAGIAIRTKELRGEIGIALGYQDQVMAAKALYAFSREQESFRILGGVMGTRMLDAQEVVALAKLPVREVLLAQIVGGLISPLRGLLTALQGNMQKLVLTLKKISEQK